MASFKTRSDFADGAQDLPERTKNLTDNCEELSKAVSAEDEADHGEDGGGKRREPGAGVKFIPDNWRRQAVFEKRKARIMKKAYELSVLTGAQVLLLMQSETGMVYTFTTPKLQPIVATVEGKQVIQACLEADTPGAGGD